jgi:transposase
VIQITPQMRVLVAIEAVDGRKGIDSLARLCQEKLQSDPFSGRLFVFRSRRGTSIRVLLKAKMFRAGLHGDLAAARLSKISDQLGCSLHGD